MDAIDKHVIETALQTLKAAGGTGLKKSALLSQIDLAAGVPTTDEQLSYTYDWNFDEWSNGANDNISEE